MGAHSPDTGTESHISTRRAAWIGVVVFGMTVPVHLLVPETVSLDLAAITLALIGGAYIGFGSQNPRTMVFWTELMVAVGFGLVAVAGLQWHWSAIPIGLALHAVWDLFHHNVRHHDVADYSVLDHKARHLASVPSWYIPFCVVFDLVAAGFFVLLYGL